MGATDLMYYFHLLYRSDVLQPASTVDHLSNDSLQLAARIIMTDYLIAFVSSSNERNATTVSGTEI